MRIDKFVCECCNCSRTQAKELIKKGFVTINDEVCKKSDIHVSDTDDVQLRGNKLIYNKYVYIMLNKPQNIICATKDKKDKTVIDLLHEQDRKKNLFVAGRLDKDSTGFVLLTNDGDFAHDILSPKKHIEKHYYVKIDMPITENMINEFENGITLADGKKLKSAVLKICENDPQGATVILSQGVFHQIKRMFGIFKTSVIKLHRFKIGNLFLDENLKQGEYKYLNNDELNKIKVKE